VQKQRLRRELMPKASLVGCAAVFLLLLAAASFVASTISTSHPTETTPAHPFRSAEARQRYLVHHDRRAEEWPVPAEAVLVATPYGDTFIRISGPENAPPLVLLHGAGGHSLQWIPNIEALSRDYRVYAIDDITGRGLSVQTLPLHDALDYTSWLASTLDALDLEGRCNMLGLSYGGWQTAQFALRFPDRINKAVLLAPAGTVLPLRPEWLVRAALTALPHRVFTRSFLHWLLEDLTHTDEARRELLDQWVDDADLARRSFKSLRLADPTVLSDTQWRSIQVPMLFIVGENEKIYSAWDAVQRLNTIAPGIETHVIPGAGHDLTIVQAGLVHEKVLEFFAR
jgi:pimeloyl-ACP methyl ester carboxylesterase